MYGGVLKLVHDCIGCVTDHVCGCLHSLRAKVFKVDQMLKVNLLTHGRLRSNIGLFSSQ